MHGSIRNAVELWRHLGEQNPRWAQIDSVAEAFRSYVDCNLGGLVNAKIASIGPDLVEPQFIINGSLASWQIAAVTGLEIDVSDLTFCHIKEQQRFLVSMPATIHSRGRLPPPPALLRADGTISRLLSVRLTQRLATLGVHWVGSTSQNNPRIDALVFGVPELRDAILASEEFDKPQS